MSGNPSGESSLNVGLSAKLDPELRDAAKSLEPVKLQLPNGWPVSLMLSPGQVRQAGAGLQMLRHLPGPRGNDNRVELPESWLDDHSVVLHVNPEMRSDAERVPWTVSLRAVDLKCPHRCCVCGAAQTRSRVVEVLGRIHSMGNIVIPHDPLLFSHMPGATSKSSADAITNAMIADRYWYTLPLCDQHDIGHGNVGVKCHHDQRRDTFLHRFTFADNEFAQEVRSSNPVEDTPEDTPNPVPQDAQTPPQILAWMRSVAPSDAAAKDRLRTTVPALDSVALADALDRLVPAQLNVASGVDMGSLLLRLSPQDLDGIQPSPRHRRNNVTIDLDEAWLTEHRDPLHTNEPMPFVKPTWAASIYVVRLQHPSRCCACEAAPTRSLLTEALSRHQHIGGKILTRLWFVDRSKVDPELPEPSDWADTALRADRYWYAFPFCDDHDLATRSVGVKTKVSLKQPTFVHRLTFADPAFGTEFRALNELVNEA